MKKFIIIAFLILLTIFILAKPIEESLAFAVSDGFANFLSAGKNKVISLEVFWDETKTLPDFYIAHLEPMGFILVSADDRSMPILGYSLENPYQEGKLPDHIKWFLEQYSKSIAEIRQHNEWSVDPLWEKIAQGDYSYWVYERDVPPLLATTWDQDWPYNSMCPSDAEGPGGHVLTGCVATAMAQIMKKWDHPITGNGSHSYDAEGYGNQTADFGSTFYNWDNMPNNITTVNDDIGTLMYHCGVSVNMHYGPDGSGAFSSDARNALVNYFRYNNSAQLLDASDYSSSTWCSMLKANLDLDFPVYYGGYDEGADAGHAFVLDGYQGTDYFHINWGWGGSCDGYFYLTNLNPGFHSFNLDQHAILYIQPLPMHIVNDLGCMSISGNTNPIVGEATPYTVTVKNNGTTTQTNYMVKLMKEGGIVLNSVTGTTINSLQTLDFTMNWTPTETGATYIYGEVFLTGDEIAASDQSPHLNVNVYPAGTVVITVGIGNSTDRMPMDFSCKNSLFETIYLASELNIVNIGSLITEIQFYNNFVTNLPNKPTNIWVGETTHTDLSAGWIPSTQLTQVFSGNVNYPSGQNDILIHLTTPYTYGGGNLVVMVERPWDIQYYSINDMFKTQTGTVANRTRNVCSYYTDYDPAFPPGTTPTANFPMTTLLFFTPVNDLGCISISGNTIPSVGDTTPYTITVKNNGTAVQSDYIVKLMKEGDILLSSVPGVPINSLQTLDFTINWTPTETGATYIYGEVELTGDEIAIDNQTPHMNVHVYPAGTVAITVGTGNRTGRMPMDFSYKNSLFETIYLASELNLNIGVLLTDIQFYNNFVTNLPNKLTNIWVGETTQTDLSAGWIPSTQLTQVFSGNVNYPSGQNDILITFNLTYPYGGENLVVMVERPMDTQYYSINDVFKTQTGTVANRTRKVQSDSTDYYPAYPPYTTPTANFPMTTLLFMTPEISIPIMVIYPLFINFGNVTVNSIVQELFSIQNIGTALLSGEITTPLGYSVMELVSKESSYISSFSQKDYTRNTLSYSINPNSSKFYKLTFAPASATTYTGNVVITSNDPNNPTVNIAVTGSGYTPNTPPTINLPESFSFIKNGTLQKDFSSYIYDEDNDELQINYSGNNNILIQIQNYLVTFSAPVNWIGTETITFSVSDGAAIAYDQVEVIVYPSPMPNWNVVVYPNNSAKVYAMVTINGEPCELNDWVGAFVGNECRGMAEVVPDNGMTYTTLFVNLAVDGENISFKIFECGTVTIYPVQEIYNLHFGETVGPINLNGISSIELTSPIVSLSPSAQGYVLSWNAVPYANQYKIYRSTVNPYEGFELIATVSTSQYIDSEVHNKAFYYVKAVNNQISKY